MSEEKTSGPHKYKLESGRSRQLRQRNKPMMPPLALFLESTFFLRCLAMSLSCNSIPPRLSLQSVYNCQLPSLLQTPETSDFTETTAIQLTVFTQDQLPHCFGTVMAEQKPIAVQSCLPQSQDKRERDQGIRTPFEGMPSIKISHEALLLKGFASTQQHHGVGTFGGYSRSKPWQ